MSSIVEQIGVEVLHDVRDMHIVRSDAPISIRFQNVCKTYRLYQNDRMRLVDGITGFKNDNYVKRLKRACNHLSFDIHEGESVAFLGANGAGKSTTMKIIAGVAFPESGTVEINGRVAAMIELSKGMNNGLTGRENLIMRGLTMGMDLDEIDAIMPEVVRFADIDDYIDQPIRTYSSGMRARLGFAFASTTSPDILVIDEALSVGDAAFRRKCVERIQKIMLDERLTVCLVTHSTSTASSVCNRGIIIKGGEAVFDGNIDEAVERYEAAK